MARLQPQRFSNSSWAPLLPPTASSFRVVSSTTRWARLQRQHMPCIPCACCGAPQTRV
ncbi:hypothetical protein BKA80DRAFT_280436 [Phyllosticta citrichinensis]